MQWIQHHLELSGWEEKNLLYCLTKSIGILSRKLGIELAKEDMVSLHHKE